MSTVKIADNRIEIHPAANIFPLMSDVEYEALVTDIRHHGLQTRIKLIGKSRESSQLLDGRNRWKAMQELGLDPYEYADVIDPDVLDDPLHYALSVNLHRRHLNESQRGMVATKVATLKRGNNQHTSIDVTSQADAAQALHVGLATVQRAKEVTEHAIPAIVDAVEQGFVTVSAAAEIAKLPTEEQKALIEAGPDAVKQAAAKRRKARGTKRKAAPAVDVAVPDAGIASPLGPFSELQELFQSVDKPDELAITRFVSWATAQSDITTIVKGCSLWLEWGSDGGAKRSA